MIELSIVAGNNSVTADMLGKSDNWQHFPKRSIEEAAEWVKQHGRVENDPIFVAKMVNTVLN